MKHIELFEAISFHRTHVQRDRERERGIDKFCYNHAFVYSTVYIKKQWHISVAIQRENGWISSLTEYFSLRKS